MTKKSKRGRPALGNAARVRATYTMSRDALEALKSRAKLHGRSRSRELESAILQPDARPFRFDVKAVAELCMRRGIEALWLFGSALNQRFGPESDVDLLVRFRPGACKSFLEFADVVGEFEGLFGRKVDLVEEHLLDNPIRKAAILGSREAIYAA